jgi:hypothetical protein
VETDKDRFLRCVAIRTTVRFSLDRHSNAIRRHCQFEVNRFFLEGAASRVRRLLLFFRNSVNER